jgi:hypothetical protein
MPIEVDRNYCGMHHHSSLVRMSTTPLDASVTPERCRDARKYGKLTITKDKYIDAKINKTVHTRLFLVGSIYENGKCRGGSHTIDNYAYSQIFVYREYTLTMISYQATFDTRTDAMLTNGYGFCKLADSSCDTGSSMIICEATPTHCQLTLLKSAEFTELVGHKWNLTNPPTRSPADRKPSITPLSTISTPIVLMTKPSQDMMRFVRKKEVIR